MYEPTPDERAQITLRDLWARVSKKRQCCPPEERPALALAVERAVTRALEKF